MLHSNWLHMYHLLILLVLLLLAIVNAHFNSNIKCLLSTGQNLISITVKSPTGEIPYLLVLSPVVHEAQAINGSGKPRGVTGCLLDHAIA